MQDFGSEISQFRRFFEMKLTHGLRFVYDARVVVVHAVDVRPYLISSLFIAAPMRQAV